jgi:hypothetical protein
MSTLMPPLRSQTATCRLRRKASATASLIPGAPPVQLRACLQISCPDPPTLRYLYACSARAAPVIPDYALTPGIVSSRLALTPKKSILPRFGGWHTGTVCHVGCVRRMVSRVTVERPLGLLVLASLLAWPDAAQVRPAGQPDKPAARAHSPLTQRDRCHLSRGATARFRSDPPPLVGQKTPAAPRGAVSEEDPAG